MAPVNKYRQYDLESEGELLTAWLPLTAKVGDLVTISADNYELVWYVKRVYEIQQDQAALHKQQSWNNNI